MRGRALLILVASLAVGCVEREPAVPAPKGEPVGCRLEGPATCALDQAPKLKVTLTNLTDAPIYLVGGLDGSECKLRYPHCTFEVVEPPGLPARRGVGRCGNTNTLRAKDFVKVAPGGSFDPYQRVDDGGFFPNYLISPETFRGPGEYRIRFAYSTAAADIRDWGGDGREKVAADRALLDLLRQVPRVAVTSNELKVTVVAPGN